jgi:chromosome partitioning protein
MLTHQKLVDFFKKNKLKRKKMVSFFSMVEQRKTMHREMIAQVGERKGKFLNAQIPYTTDVEQMGWTRQPVACFRPRSKATQAYRELWVELQRLK